MSKITGVAARLQTRQDPALKQKAKELSAFLKDQAQYMEQASTWELERKLERARSMRLTCKSCRTTLTRWVSSMLLSKTSFAGQQPC